MKTIAAAFLTFLLLSTVNVFASSATVSGKLVDRQCSVEDVFQLQPAVEKYGVLTIRESYTIGGVTYLRDYKVYCPNQKTIAGFTYSSYVVCCDPTGLQINHPTRTYTITGTLRTEEEAKDGRGQIVASQIQQ